MILVCEEGLAPSPEPVAKQTWSERNVEISAVLAQQSARLWAPLLSSPITPFLAETRIETPNYCPGPSPAPFQAPLGTTVIGTWCPGNVMNACTALVSVLNYPLK